ncbi:MAG: type II secretion system inner membrane protein GspF [Deltaproteobacteria bacterium]
MPLYEYSGYNAAGRKVSGVIEGSGQRTALQQLKLQGITATQLVPQTTAGHSRPGLQLFQQERRVPVRELAAATRQLAALLGAGIPLVEALATIAGQQERPYFAKALNQIREELIQGQSFAQGLAQHPRIFSELFVNMVQVGESSGTLDQVMHRLADFLEEQDQLKSRIQSALAYPILMALIGSGVLVFLMTFVVPKITQMVEDMGRVLPLPTRLLIGLSHFLSATWWVFLLVAALGVWAGRRYLRTDRGRWQLDRTKLRLPLIGKLNLLLLTARFTRTLATLLRSGVTLLAALEIVHNLISNRVIKKTIEETIRAVREGEGLAPPLQRAGVFPKMVPQMAAVGEKSGELEEMMLKVADVYERQVDSTINTLLSLLEPLMILMMGAVVGFIIMAILLPIYQASQGIS